MDGFNPFKAASLSFAIAAGVTPSPGAVIFPGASGEATYVFDNTRNTAAVWLGIGMTSAAAQTNAVVPSLGGTSPAIGIGKGTVQAVTFNAGMYVSAIMEQGSGTITGQAGYGT